MEERKIKIGAPHAFLVFFCVLGLVCLLVFVITMLSDWHESGFEWFELIARIIGYVATLALCLCSALGARRYLARGDYGGMTKQSLTITICVTLILCVHDVLLYIDYGNDIGGTFTMVSFFLLDAAILLLCLAAIFFHHKRPQARALPVIFGASALLWAIYAVGDIAGYPVSSVEDWDESLMKLTIMGNSLFLMTAARSTAKAEQI